MDAITILEYCCGELEKRADDAEGQLAWFWEIRLKVARFSLAMLRRYGVPRETLPPLSPSQQAVLLATHPLLTQHDDRPTTFRPDSRWIEDLRRRTMAYLETVRKARRAR